MWLEMRLDETNKIYRNSKSSGDTTIVYFSDNSASCFGLVDYHQVDKES
jgi:hypothetical protein